MQSSQEDKLIKLPILQYYDENIKKWVSDKLSNIESTHGGNVQVSKIEPIIGGNRVTFTYTLDDGTLQNSYLEVMNGEKGASITSATIQDGILSFTLSNGETISAGAITIDESKINLENYYTKEQAEKKFVQLIELDNLIAKKLEENFTAVTNEEIENLFKE
ncbi:MAG: hypothetical protein HFH92_17495 [Lachnospiraceae bacterium]|nr:hypothetical protein [Lachnospiraceae bacterium]